MQNVFRLSSIHPVSIILQMYNVLKENMWTHLVINTLMSKSIVLPSFMNHFLNFLSNTVPNQVSPSEDPSTVDSVSATWTRPVGVITGYEIECNSGIPLPASGNDTLTRASCTDLPIPGEQYEMTITSISNDQRNSVTYILRTCKRK